ncbi:putative cue domain-containing protein [Phaeoacremonium minimum UCRPA7]|uniref:Putative cue domain-containing protein n=1 Tax=Phaeoacremonium minimum (strain UCR-PA7) TaxID=1286976 RepID=R8BGR1_PHAM7|nr:putative cue domain-containing protein [Phaeoacremonium minimum UCRPA7]EON98474.1 putative cue domain-containing protein [Phaeoacremonium minimum UCRPA7]
MALSLPSFAPFPSPAWRELIALDEWNACLGAWISLAEAHLGLLDSEFTQKSLKDESLQQFLTDCMRQVASSGSSILGTSNPAKLLMKDCFLLTARILKLPSIPSIFTQWEFLADFSRVYGKKRVAAVLSSLPKSSQAAFEHTLGDLKKFLIKNLDAGLAGDLKAVEQRLDQLNSLIHASPSTASFFLAGSDFLDGLISCYKIMNPPLRKVIITTTYLSLVGLIEGESPKLSMLTDQLYSLKTAADTHKAGPLNVNDSLVAELVTTTPILQQIEHKLEISGTATTRTKNVLKDLAAYRKPGVGLKPKRLIKRKVDKGKALALDDRSAMEGEVHIHHMSQISQIQDLFPELGSGFVSKLLDEYDGDSEQVIAHLLEDSLPPHLQGADRDLAPHPTPPQIPARKNVFDDDELDTLALGTSKLHIGKRDAKKTADDVLADRSTAPNKAAILSALAAFDSDDDERDDTYDAEDVGGTVDAANTEEPADSKDGNEEALFRAYQTDTRVFERDAATRRSVARTKLRHETGMTDEAIEGWAVMLTRNPNQKRKLELKYSAVGAFTGQQSELVSTAWRPSPAGSGAEESDVDGGRPAFRGGRGRGRGRGGRGGRGDAAGPPGEQGTEQARRRKEANKGSRANHNRRDQRAKKMARGGFPG